MTKLLNPKAKIVVVKKDNPFTPGTEVHKRMSAVLAAPTVGAAVKKGARTSTVRWAVAHRLVKVTKETV